MQFCDDPDPDRLTLQRFFREMHGDGRERFFENYKWKNNRYWFIDDAPLNAWYGVTEDGAGYVTGLSLKDNNLRGRLSSQVCNLSKLELLDLSDNDISELPACLGDMENLRWLALNGNSFEEVPADLDEKLEARAGQLYYLNLINEELGDTANQRQALSLAVDAANGIVEGTENIGIRNFGPVVRTSLKASQWVLGKAAFIADNAGLTVLFNELNAAGNDDNERFAAALRYLGVESPVLKPLLTISTEDFDCFTDPNRQWWECTG